MTSVCTSRFVVIQSFHIRNLETKYAGSIVGYAHLLSMAFYPGHWLIWDCGVQGCEGLGEVPDAEECDPNTHSMAVKQALSSEFKTQTTESKGRLHLVSADLAEFSATPPPVSTIDATFGDTHKARSYMLPQPWLRNLSSRCYSKTVQKTNKSSNTGPWRLAI